MSYGGRVPWQIFCEQLWTLKIGGSQKTQKITKREDFSSALLCLHGPQTQKYSPFLCLWLMRIAPRYTSIRCITGNFTWKGYALLVHRICTIINLEYVHSPVNILIDVHIDFLQVDGRRRLLRRLAHVRWDMFSEDSVSSLDVCGRHWHVICQISSCPMGTPD